MNKIELDNILIDRLEMIEERFNISISNFLIQYCPDDLDVFCDVTSNTATNISKQFWINAALYDQNNNILAHSRDLPNNPEATSIRERNKFNGFHRSRIRFFNLGFDISEIKRILVFPS